MYKDLDSRRKSSKRWCFKADFLSVWILLNYRNLFLKFQLSLNHLSCIAESEKTLNTTTPKHRRRVASR